MESLRTSDFDYILPLELIAQRPSPVRDESRLMILDRKTGDIKHRTFRDLTDFLSPNDILVLNDTWVIPARIYGKKATGGKIEILLLRRIMDDAWEALVHGKVGVGTKLIFGDGKLEGEIIEKTEAGSRVINFKYKGNFWNLLSELGETPLPPYIKEKNQESGRYQTIYAKKKGASAAPTAGLHFTEKLLKRINDKGVKTTFVTLHTGLATFRPVKEEFIKDHHMHKEYFEVSEEAAKLINEAKEKGGKVIAVGTTTVRVLETANDGKKVTPDRGDTELFIYPGYQFKIVDGIVTNFHFPQSTLLMLISAFTDRQNIFKAYEEAVKEKYRFYSFGDAMLIL